ncbi:MAG: transporter substrate-binding domain-containing protein, partial [Syntrophobacteraceae bacterium]
MKKTQLLITISILILSATLLAFSQSSASGNPLIFAGDKNFPPVEYLENSIPRGLNVELLNELSRILGREIDIRLMQWEEAQQKVLDGEIDAITTMAITEKRKELFDFSDITLRYQYCLFVNSQQVGIRTVSDLEGRAVGITEGGLPQQVLESNPKIKLVIVKDYAEGFRLLLSQEIDAVGADRWVGAYTLLENDIRGVTIIEEPIAEKVSGIAVKKGNTELLNEINLALSKLKTEGTIKTIEEKWATKEVLLLTRGQIRTSIIYGGAVLLILVVGGASLWISSLRKQIRLREKTSRELDKKTRELNAILSSVQDYLY